MTRSDTIPAMALIVFGRWVLTSAGAVEVAAPRVNDKHTDEQTGERRRFSSAILPPCRKSTKINEVLPPLILAAAGVHVVLIRLRYAGWVDEVINSAGTVATWAVNAWTLIDHDLSLELGASSGMTFGASPRAFFTRKWAP